MGRTLLLFCSKSTWILIPGRRRSSHGAMRPHGDGLRIVLDGAFEGTHSIGDGRRPRAIPPLGHLWSAA